MTYFTPGILPSALRVCAKTAQLKNVPDVFVTWFTMQKYVIAGTPKSKKATQKQVAFQTLEYPGDDLLYSRRPAFRPPGLLRSSKCSGHFSHMSHVQVGIVRAIKTKKASHKGGFSF